MSQFAPVPVHSSFFTVYLSKHGIELHPGCQDYPNTHVLFSSRSYESAQHFAQIAASIRHLPLKSWVNI
ncbi:hypothetical protein H6F51_10410 [Cyanobacteria bacterium FACHB-DQ100]|nr:hypothetical protein [Cyanobacteria bacterium FACHB-DQ100]